MEAEEKLTMQYAYANAALQRPKKDAICKLQPLTLNLLPEKKGGEARKKLQRPFVFVPQMLETEKKKIRPFVFVIHLLETEQKKIPTATAKLVPRQNHLWGEIKN